MQLRLNPRFDGAFLNSEKTVVVKYSNGLNPRFDGAFLNCMGDATSKDNAVS